MEADQVDPAAEPCEQPRQRGDVRRRIVDSAKDDVLEADSALMREVVPPQLGDHLLDRIAALGGHHGCALGGDRVVQADGQMHPVDSSEMAFKTAARLALKKCVDADPVLLEPIYSLDITVPDEYMGDIIGDMNRRRGRILGIDLGEDGRQIIHAEVPLAEILKYATDLRSMTQGRGSYDREFLRYEEFNGKLKE